MIADHQGTAVGGDLLQSVYLNPEIKVIERFK